MKHISAYFSHTVTEDRKFAWIPIKTDSGHLLWLRHYYYVEKYFAVLDTYRMLNTYIYTEEEFFIKKLANENRENDYSMRD